MEHTCGRRGSHTCSISPCSEEKKSPRRLQKNNLSFNGVLGKQQHISAYQTGVQRSLGADRLLTTFLFSRVLPKKALDSLKSGLGTCLFKDVG